MRRPLIAANWKMNLNLAQSRDLATQIRSRVAADQALAAAVDFAICPPAVYLYAVVDACRGASILVGAQNIYFETAGAFTGEISAAMVADIGAEMVILGHSERRHVIGHHEDDRMINQKLRAAMACSLTPILCVGETLAERDAGATLDVLTFQITAGLNGIDLRDASRLVIAYEPVWAIGTGRNATPEQAQEAHDHLRRQIRRIVGDHADDIRILYGGSLKPDNAAAIFSQPDIDGGLVGGASLKAESFLGIAAAALSARR